MFGRHVFWHTWVELYRGIPGLGTSVDHNYSFFVMVCRSCFCVQNCGFSSYFVRFGPAVLITVGTTKRGRCVNYKPRATTFVPITNAHFKNVSIPNFCTFMTRSFSVLTDISVMRYDGFANLHTVRVIIKSCHSPVGQQKLYTFVVEMRQAKLTFDSIFESIFGRFPSSISFFICCPKPSIINEDSNLLYSFPSSTCGTSFLSLARKPQILRPPSECTDLCAKRAQGECLCSWRPRYNFLKTKVPSLFMAICQRPP